MFRINRAAFVVYVICLVFITQFTTFAQQEYCDEDILLTAKTQTPLTYQPRGDRCEGSYDGGAHPPVSLISLTEYVEPYDLTTNQELVFQWTAPKSPSVQIRAEGLRTSYRLDTVRPAGENSYRLPLDVLSALDISHDQLGVLGWAHSKAGDVYVPLRLTQQGNPQQSDTYRVILWPEMEFNEVYISLATVNADGDPEEFIQNGKPLEYGYYQSKRVIVFDIPKPDKPGAYYLEIGVTLQSGGSDNVAYFFYHAG